jgi:hypothetical protein
VHERGRLPVAVLDTSVLVPLWSRHILQEIAEGTDAPYIPAWSEWIIAETWRTLALYWLSRTGEAYELGWLSLSRAANDMLRRLLPVMEFVTLRDYAGPDPWPRLTDDDDVPIWQAAVLAGAQYVVSQNTRHFPPLTQGRHTYGGIEYLTAIEFIDDVLGENAEQLHGGPLPQAAALRSRRVP